MITRCNSPPDSGGGSRDASGTSFQPLEGTIDLPRDFVRRHPRFAGPKATSSHTVKSYRRPASRSEARMPLRSRRATAPSSRPPVTVARDPRTSNRSTLRPEAPTSATTSLAPLQRHVAKRGTRWRIPKLAWSSVKDFMWAGTRSRRTSAANSQEQRPAGGPLQHGSGGGRSACDGSRAPARGSRCERALVHLVQRRQNDGSARAR